MQTALIMTRMPTFGHASIMRVEKKSKSSANSFWTLRMRVIIHKQRPLYRVTCASVHGWSTIWSIQDDSNIVPALQAKLRCMPRLSITRASHQWSLTIRMVSVSCFFFATHFAELCLSSILCGSGRHSMLHECKHLSTSPIRLLRCNIKDWTNITMVATMTLLCW